MNEELKILISAEITKLQQGVQKAKDAVKGFKAQVEKASKDVDKHFKAMGTAMLDIGKKAATGLAAAGTALLALGASTAEYRAEQARLVSAFETVGGSAEQAKETYNDLYRVLGDTGTATEAAQQLANITTEEEKLAEYTNICQGVYAKWGTAIDTAGLAEGINHTIELGEVQGTLADALEFSGVNVDSFNEKLAACNSESEREKLVRETLNGMYSEAASAYEENNKAVLEQNEAQAKLQETTAKLGEAVAPVVTAFTNFASEALAAVVPYIQELSDKYLPLLKELLTGVAEALGAVFEWMTEHKTLLGIIAGVIGTLVAAIGLYNAVAAVKAAMDALQVTTLAGLVAAYMAQAAAMLIAIAPYVLAVAAIAAIIAIIVVCVKHWDKISAKVKEVAKNIGKWVSEMASKAVAKFKELVSKASEKVEELKRKCSEKFQSIKTTISEKIQSAKKSVVDGFNNMVSSAKDKLSSMVTAVKDKFDSIRKSIRDKINSAKDAVKEAIEKIKGFFKFEWSLPKPKIPKFSVSGGEAPWGFGGKGSLPKINITWHALGGVFDMPTLFATGNGLHGLGENGAEAIVPLENNLGWLDKLATMLNDRMGGNTPIVLNVDGKVFAQTAINTINAQTRQTGRLQLNLV